MTHRRAVLGPLNGTLHPQVLFIGEAPGRRGAEQTRRPFSGDASGNRFEELLAHAGLRREEIFISNAVLCCPASDRRNQTPAASEIGNCGAFLARTIELLTPPVVATVGAVALRSLGTVIGRQFKLAEVAGSVIALDCSDRLQWRPFRLVPLYHPSPRVLHTVRRIEQQKSDFLVLRRVLAGTPGCG
jgi:uracil-DNA glycosylase